MTTIHTHHLTGVALDWAVAHAEGLLQTGAVAIESHHSPWPQLIDRRGKMGLSNPNWLNPNWLPWSPSKDWYQAGPIVDREGISIIRPEHYNHWVATDNIRFDRIRLHSMTYSLDGETPLIAAMRYFVFMKLDDVVDVPQELAP